MRCFTLGRYATVNDVIKLKGLPVEEKIQFNTAKFVHKALYKEGFPHYLKLELTSNVRALWSNTETRITPFGRKIRSHMEDQQYSKCYLKISKNLILKKNLFLQFNSISSIKLTLMLYKLLINLAFIFCPLLLSLSEFNQQTVYINFVCDLSTCDLYNNISCFHAFYFYALLFIRSNLNYTFQLYLTLYVSTL